MKAKPKPIYSFLPNSDKSNQFQRDSPHELLIGKHVFIIKHQHD